MHWLWIGMCERDGWIGRRRWPQQQPYEATLHLQWNKCFGRIAISRVSGEKVHIFISHMHPICVGISHRCAFVVLLRNVSYAKHFLPFKFFSLFLFCYSGFRFASAFVSHVCLLFIKCMQRIYGIWELSVSCCARQRFVIGAWISLPMDDGQFPSNKYIMAVRGSEAATISLFYRLSIISRLYGCIVQYVVGTQITYSNWFIAIDMYAVHIKRAVSLDHLHILKSANRCHCSHTQIAQFDYRICVEITLYWWEFVRAVIWSSIAYKLHANNYVVHPQILCINYVVRVLQCAHHMTDTDWIYGWWRSTSDFFHFAIVVCYCHNLLFNEIDKKLKRVIMPIDDDIRLTSFSVRMDGIWGRLS